MNVLIADDHDVVRRGLNDLLREEFADVCTAEATSGAEVLEKLSEQKWDLILLDILMPDTEIIDLLEALRAVDSQVPVLILTAMAEAEYATSTIRAGANGYIPKQYATSELIIAVNRVLAGDTYLSKDAVAALTQDLRSPVKESPHELLSTRELEVFLEIARGKAVKTIAYDLNLSAKTVATYVTRIREKTGLSNHVEIARYAMQHKLVD